VFFDGIDLAARRIPNLRVLVVGRGTHMEWVAVRRARRTSISDRIVFTGYREGDEYVGTLAVMDAKVFLWPGSDGSCRAVREAMSMGRPVIAADIGMLPEIVTDGEDGLIVPHDAEALAAAIERLAKDPEGLSRMSAAATATAERRFDLDSQVDAVLDVYDRILGIPGGNGRA
jgi:glycosyltransferase involved in cell wall biosynthesis